MIEWLWPAVEWLWSGWSDSWTSLAIGGNVYRFMGFICWYFDNVDSI